MMTDSRQIQHISRSIFSNNNNKFFKIYFYPVQRIKMIVIRYNDTWLNLPLMIAGGFLIGMTNYHACLARLHKFQSDLDAKEQKVYQEIIQERKQTTISSFFLAVLIAAVYTLCAIFLYNKSLDYHLFSEILAIILSLTYFVYILSVKKKSMLVDANLSTEEIREWYNVYVCMERQFHLYFLYGFLLVGGVLMFIDILNQPVHCTYVHFDTNMKKKLRKKKVNKKSKNP
jgi:hypothetical protein